MGRSWRPRKQGQHSPAKKKEKNAPYALRGKGKPDGRKTKVAGEEATEGRTGSLREKPSGPRWTGIGFYMENQQEAYDAELFAIMRGVYYLAS